MRLPLKIFTGLFAMAGLVTLMFIGKGCKKKELEVITQKGEVTNNPQFMTEEEEIEAADEHIRILSIGFIDAVKDEVIWNEIITAVSNPDNEGEVLPWLGVTGSCSGGVIEDEIDLYMRFANKMNESIIKYTGMDPGTDYATEAANSIIVNEVKYPPIMNIINYETADFDLEPIIAVGIEVSDEEEEEEDAIMMWDEDSYTALGELQWVPLTEADAMAESRPVIIITTGSSDHIVNCHSGGSCSGGGSSGGSSSGGSSSGGSSGGSGGSSGGGSGCTGTAMNITFDELKINQACENLNWINSHMEVKFMAVMNNGTSNVTNAWGDVADVHMNDLGDWVFPQATLASWSDGCGSMTLLLYEYDWYSTKKQLSCTQNSITVNMPDGGFKAKFVSDIYYFGCLGLGPQASDFPSVGSTKVYNGSKCDFKLKRN